MIRSKLFAIGLFLMPLALIAAVTLATGYMPLAAPAFIIAAPTLFALALTPMGDTVTAWAIRQLARAVFGIDLPFVADSALRAPQTGRPELTSFA